MDTRPVAVVDAFADEPMTGTPVGVVLDAGDLASGQRAAVASEVGPPTTAFLDGTAVEVLASHDVGRGSHVAIAVASALRDRGGLDEALDLRMGETAVTVSRGSAGRLWEDVPEPEVRETDLAEGDLADALGIDPAACRDVGADLPPVRASLGRGFVLVPVNFLEALSGATPSGEAVSALLEAEGAAAMFAYTFDTLEGESQIHGLLVGPDGGAAPETGEAAACAAAAVQRYGALDREAYRFETGDLQGRPARPSVRCGTDWQVGGRGVTVLEGTVAVPPAESGDDIIEV